MPVALYPPIPLCAGSGQQKSCIPMTTVSPPRFANLEVLDKMYPPIPITTVSPPSENQNGYEPVFLKKQGGIQWSSGSGGGGDTVGGLAYLGIWPGGVGHRWGDTFWGLHWIRDTHCIPPIARGVYGRVTKMVDAYDNIK